MPTTYEEMMKRANACQEKLKNDPAMNAINDWALKNVKKDRPTHTTGNTLEWLTGMLKNLDE